MAGRILIKRKSSRKPLLAEILGEVKKLRREISLFLPQEDIADYAHPERIERSYRRALKQHPPRR